MRAVIYIFVGTLVSKRRNRLTEKSQSENQKTRKACHGGERTNIYDGSSILVYLKLWVM